MIKSAALIRSRDSYLWGKWRVTAVPVFLFSVACGVRVTLGLLRQLIQLHINLIPSPFRLDLHTAPAVTTHHIRRCPDTLQRIA